MTAGRGPRPRVQIITDAQGAHVFVTRPNGEPERIDLTEDDALLLVEQSAYAALALRDMARRPRAEEPAPPHFLDTIGG